MEYEGDWEAARRFEWAPSLAGVCNLLRSCRRLFSGAKEGCFFMKRRWPKKKLALRINGEQILPTTRLGYQTEMIPMCLIFSTVGIPLQGREKKTAPVAISKSNSSQHRFRIFDSIRIDVRNERSRKVFFSFSSLDPYTKTFNSLMLPSPVRIWKNSQPFRPSPPFFFCTLPGPSPQS